MSSTDGTRLATTKGGKEVAMEDLFIPPWEKTETDEQGRVWIWAVRFVRVQLSQEEKEEAA